MEDRGWKMAARQCREFGTMSERRRCRLRAEHCRAQIQNPKSGSLANLIEPFKFSGERRARDVPPVADVDLVGTVRAFETAKALDVFFEPADLLLHREFSRMIGSRRMPPDDARASPGRQKKYAFVDPGVAVG